MNGKEVNKFHYHFQKVDWQRKRLQGMKKWRKGFKMGIEMVLITMKMSGNIIDINLIRGDILTRLFPSRRRSHLNGNSCGSVTTIKDTGKW